MLAATLLVAFSGAKFGEDSSIKLIHKQEQHKVEVRFDGQLFTSYLYSPEFKKPVLYPIKTQHSNQVTRGYPLEPQPGERADHPHHVGLWLNYGDVNGLDFWNNSDAVPPGEEDEYGTVVHRSIDNIESGSRKGLLEVTHDWVGPGGKPLLEEQATFIFRSSGNKRIIDRITTLQALDEKVSLRDNKEGMLGLRVARELEHPSDEPVLLIDESGRPADREVVDNEGVSGTYLSSSGIEGPEVWGTRARWMNLSGQIEGEQVSVAILDHPENVGFPTYWHARGYGLFAANPLGQKALSGGQKELNFELAAGRSMTFRHRVIIYSGQAASDSELDQDWEQFRDTF
ncbi:PmoA family protein [Halalkalibaculum sp. DA3122]